MYSGGRSGVDWPASSGGTRKQKPAYLSQLSQGLGWWEQVTACGAGYKEFNFEKVSKNCTKTSYKKTNLTNMSKSKKVQISVSFLLITFFVCNFFFKGVEISIKFWVFWYPFWNFKKYLFCLYPNFFKTLKGNAQETAPKTGKRCYRGVLQPQSRQSAKRFSSRWIGTPPPL